LNRFKADLLVLAAALIWGVAFYFQKVAMDHVGPFLFTGSRAVIAALVLAPFALRERRNGPAEPLSLFPIAIFGGLAFTAAGVLQQAGITTATVTNTSFLTALYVVLTPFLLWLIRSERPGLRVWIAAIVAFFGIWALGGGTLDGFSRGDWLVAACAIFWALYMVATSASSKAARPLQYTCYSFATVALICLPVSLLTEQPSFQSLADAAVPMLYVGILSSALTFALLSVSVQHIPAARASILLSTETLFAAAAGFLLLGERLSLIGWMGAALVFAAILLIQTEPKPQKTE